MKAIKLPSRDLLIKLFEYKSGSLYWKERPAYNIKINSQAGNTEKSGYVRIKIMGQTYLAHRLIFKMIHNIEPDYIDHINNIKSDNRIENLQEISFSQNKLKGGLYLQKNNKSGHKGIYFDKRKKKWVTRISINSKRINIGAYNELNKAIYMRSLFEDSLLRNIKK